MDVEVYPYLSGISWRASLLGGDSYLLTAGPQAATYSFVVINESILSVQNIKDLLSSLPAWELSALHLGLLEVEARGVFTAAHSCICVLLMGPCRPALSCRPDPWIYSIDPQLSHPACIVEYDLHEPL